MSILDMQIEHFDWSHPTYKDVLETYGSVKCVTLRDWMAVLSESPTTATWFLLEVAHRCSIEQRSEIAMLAFQKAVPVVAGCIKERGLILPVGALGALNRMMEDVHLEVIQEHRGEERRVINSLYEVQRNVEDQLRWSDDRRMLLMELERMKSQYHRSNNSAEWSRDWMMRFSEIEKRIADQDILPMLMEAIQHVVNAHDCLVDARVGMIPKFMSSVEASCKATLKVDLIRLKNTRLHDSVSKFSKIVTDGFGMEM